MWERTGAGLGPTGGGHWAAGAGAVGRDGGLASNFASRSATVLVFLFFCFICL